jgi:hypothetical protein
VVVATRSNWVVCWTQTKFILERAARLMHAPRAIQVQPLHPLHCLPSGRGHQFTSPSWDVRPGAILDLCWRRCDSPCGSDLLYQAIRTLQVDRVASQLQRGNDLITSKAPPAAAVRVQPAQDVMILPWPIIAAKWVVIKLWIAVIQHGVFRESHMLCYRRPRPCPLRSDVYTLEPRNIRATLARPSSHTVTGVSQIEIAAGFQTN